MTEITKCRICKSDKLRHVLSLGEQALTGVFPKPGENVPSGPLDLVWCQKCTLLQLKQSYPPSEMYGANYGYRSGLNKSMVKHLQEKARMLAKMVKLQPFETVLDIGSNDGTLLNAFDAMQIRIGMDPTAPKFMEHYQRGVTIIDTFFSREAYLRYFETQAVLKALGANEAPRPRIITSIAMFYDLEDPVAFARDVEAVLADDGLWHFEQHYLPSMLRTGAYDAICHEHLEYYRLRNIEQILDAVGMRIVDISMNAVNGGSIAVTACKREAKYETNKVTTEWLLGEEAAMYLDSLRPYLEFEQKVKERQSALIVLCSMIGADGKSLAAYGASTKGNVLLQHCQLGNLVNRVYEINHNKFGHVTPGTNIPIVSEANLMKDMPDYLLVLPWHFKAGILENLSAYREAGGRVIFPLPEIEVL